MIENILLFLYAVVIGIAAGVERKLSTLTTELSTDISEDQIKTLERAQLALLIVVMAAVVQLIITAWM